MFDYYKNKLGRSVNLSGTTGTSSELSVALDQSRCGKMFKNQPGKSVLFVFLIRNYSFQFFFRANKPEYSPYPYEQEHLLMVGLMLSVVGIEENVVIQHNSS